MLINVIIIVVIIVIITPSANDPLGATQSPMDATPVANPNEDICFKLREGPPALEEALRYLEGLEPMEPLVLCRGLTAASKFHAEYLGASGRNGHDGAKMPALFGEKRGPGLLGATSSAAALQLPDYNDERGPGQATARKPGIVGAIVSTVSSMGRTRTLPERSHPGQRADLFGKWHGHWAECILVHAGGYVCCLSDSCMKI